MSITNNVINHPKMDYDSQSHRYRLKESILDRNIYADQYEVRRALKRQSNLLYMWIYQNIHPANRLFVDHLLTHDEGYVSAIFEALNDFADADQLSGAAENAYHIDANTSDIQALERMIPLTVKLVMKNANSHYNIFAPFEFVWENFQIREMESQNASGPR